MAARIPDSPPNPECKIMTFRPSMEEFRDFHKYVAYMESQGAHRAGIAKVIPPKEWKPRKNYDDIEDLVIPGPIQQTVTGSSGVFTQYSSKKKPMTVKEFKELAYSSKYRTPRHKDYEDLERKYWKAVIYMAPIYGADTNGSIYDEDVKEWNVAQLNTILDVVEDCGICFEGVNTPYLYFGMWKTTFAWHTEDMDLYSINYLHFGEPKSWYAIPPEHGKQLEKLAEVFFKESSEECSAFLRHKTVLISPSVLKKHKVPFDKITQEAGEFIITFPYGYHSGFNHGFNCAESTNFATFRWIDYGKAAKLCNCSKDMVVIPMDIFVKTFQPDRYQLWKEGKDLYTIDHTKPTPQSTPEVQMWMKRREETKGREETKEREGRKGRKRRKETKDLPECSKQQKRPPAKKLKPPKGKKVAAKGAGAEIIVSEAATDGVKVIEEPDAGVPSGEEENSGRKQLDQNVKVTGGAHSDSLLRPVPVQEKTGTDSSHRVFTCDDSVVRIRAFNSCRAEESLKSQGQSVSSVPCDKSEGHASEAKNPDKEENASIESDVSDVESPVSSMEFQEVSVAKENEQDDMETSNPVEVKRKKTRDLRSRSKMTLAKQQATTHKKLPETALTEEEFQETETWDRPLVYLWRSKAPSFNAEKEYNLACAKKKPYCAICAIFMPYSKTGDHDEESPSLEEANSAETLMGKNEKTKPLTLEMCFTCSEGDAENHPSHAFVEADGTSVLISCAKCFVRVHASCYGVSPSEIQNEWLCSRCKNGAWRAVCCLCTLRGGALKQTTENKWVHIVCAIAIPEVRFVNVIERAPIDTSRIPSKRLKLKCVFCIHKVKKNFGACIQYSCRYCTTAFHVTCGHAAGVIMEPGNRPDVVYVKCCKHNTKQDMIPKASEAVITVGQIVIAKHKNKRYYSCKVTGEKSQIFYKVVFDDGSFSLDTYPEDIISRDCLALGPPAEGEVVQVKWSDGKVYTAKYLGSSTMHMYQVEFEDGSQIAVKREDIRTLEEELPKRVKARFSTASYMRFEDTFSEAGTTLREKRQRVLNSRYNYECVGDSRYHAFLKKSFQKK